MAWIGYGFIITLLPLLIIGCVGRYFYKLNYFTLMGLIAGSTTDPPTLTIPIWRQEMMRRRLDMRRFIH